MGGVHAADVFGRCLLAHQDDLLVLGGLCFGLCGVEDHLADRCPWGGRKALGNDFPGAGVGKRGMEELIELSRSDAQEGFLL